MSTPFQPTELTPVPPLALSDAERELLAAEIPLFAATLKDPVTRDRYTQLAIAVGDGTVPGPLVAPLETMLELLLQAQRIRREHGPDGESTLLRLFQRAPRGAAMKEAAQEVNEALTALQGQALEKLSFSPTARGYAITLDTDRCHLALSIDRAGVRIDRMEVGG